MKNKAFAISEAVGCVVIYAAAIVLHFAFRWFGPGALTLLFGAVNESVWEHVKIFSAAYVGYALLQLLWIKVPFKRYVAAKCAGLYALMGGIIAFHYGYTAFTGKHIAWVDILGSAVIVILVQLLSYKLTVGSLPLEDYFAPSLFLLMLYYLMFFSFTIYPPKAELFRDPISGGFGYQGFSMKKQ
ncbi:MAG: hypothetical protein IJ639_08300 [Ruminococcus sp.]|nr:hypothetical protein [Ruminococcus sp.]